MWEWGLQKMHWTMLGIVHSKSVMWLPVLDDLWSTMWEVAPPLFPKHHQYPETHSRSCWYSSAPGGRSLCSTNVVWGPNWKTLLFRQVCRHLCLLWCCCRSLEWQRALLSIVWGMQRKTSTANAKKSCSVPQQRSKHAAGLQHSSYWHARAIELTWETNLL